MTFLYLIFMCSGVFSTCIFVLHIYACGQGSQKTMLDPLEPELQVVVSFHVGAENQTQSSIRAASALNL